MDSSNHQITPATLLTTPGVRRYYCIVGLPSNGQWSFDIFMGQPCRTVCMLTCFACEQQGQFYVGVRGNCPQIYRPTCWPYSKAG